MTRGRARVSSHAAIFRPEEIANVQMDLKRNEKVVLILIRIGTHRYINQKIKFVQDLVSIDINTHRQLTAAASKYISLWRTVACTIKGL